jgi:tetraacyldisaccharide 4'-kinase
MNRSSLERSLQRIWYGPSKWFDGVLLPLAWIFFGLVSVRRMAYRRGLLKSERVVAPVLVIGNVTVGGTGKTPLVGWLASRLSALGYRPGIVSRGYGGAVTRQPRMVTADSSYRDVGDEALVLGQRTGLPVCVGRDRVAAARMLIERGVNVILSDDGLQHYRLQRDMEIAVVDGARGLGNGRLLPAGPLREPANRLAQVDFIVVNGASAMEGAFRMDLMPVAAIRLGGDEERPLTAFAGTRVWAVAGIGNPDRFSALLQCAGIEPMVVAVPDHGVTSLEALRLECSQPILMTEKDAVKYKDTAIIDVWYIPVDVSLSEADEQRIMNRVNTMTSEAVFE